MLKKIFVTYLVPFKVISVKVTDRFKRVFDSVQTLDASFRSTIKSVVDGAMTNDELIKTTQKTLGPDTVLVEHGDYVNILCTKFLGLDQVGSTDSLQRIDLTKSIVETLGTVDWINRIDTKAAKFDQASMSDFFDRTVVFKRSFEDTSQILESRAVAIAKPVVDYVYGFNDELHWCTCDYADALYWDSDFTLSTHTRSFGLGLVDVSNTFDAPAQLLRPSDVSWIIDMGGSMIINTFVDSSYYAEDYTGSIASF